MYVCMCVCMGFFICVYYESTYVRTYCMMHVCAYECMNVRACAWAWAWAGAGVCSCVCVRVCAGVRACVRVCVCVCVCVYV